MKRYVALKITMFLICFLMPHTIQAKTAKDTSPFEYETVSEGENACRITGIRIIKDKGISELEIPDTINGKTVVSIGVGKITNKWNEEVEANAFLMYSAVDSETWKWVSDTKIQEQRAKKIKKIILPDTIKEINEFAFAGMRDLKTIKLSQNLTMIGRCAFGATSIQKMRLPSGLTTIGEKIFFKAPIRDINIPAKLKEGVADLARTTVSWKHFTISKKNSAYKIKKGLLLSKNGKIVYAMIAPKKKICIPDKVKTLASSAFYNLNIRSIYLGAGVKEIKS